jgi:hypothetical protein
MPLAMASGTSAPGSASARRSPATAKVSVSPLGLPTRIGLCLGDDGLKGLRVLGGQLLGNLRVQLAHIAEGLQRLPVASGGDSGEQFGTRPLVVGD